MAKPLNYATSSGAPQRQPLHHVLAHLFNHQTHHRGQAHHLVGLALGREATPVLDLLAYQRSVAARSVGALFTDLPGTAMRSTLATTRIGRHPVTYR